MTDKKFSIWTENELTVLREMREARKPVPEIAALLGRPVTSVYAQARKIGTRVLEVKPWTETEDHALTALARDGVVTRVMAENLTRSEASVIARLKALGLTEIRNAAYRAKIEAAAQARKTDPARPKPQHQTTRPPRAERSITARSPMTKIAASLSVEDLSELAKTMTAAEVANHLGHKIEVIRLAAKMHDLRFFDPDEAKREADLARLRELMSEGQTTEEIANALGRSKSWVVTNGERLGLRTKRERRKPEETSREDLEALARKMTITDAARHIGRDVRTLRKIAEAFGITFQKAPARQPPKRVATGGTGVRKVAAKVVKVVPTSAKGTVTPPAPRPAAAKVIEVAAAVVTPHRHPAHARITRTLSRSEPGFGIDATQKSRLGSLMTRSDVPPLTAAERAARLELIRAVAQRMRDEGRLPPH